MFALAQNDKDIEVGVTNVTLSLPRAPAQNNNAPEFPVAAVCCAGFFKMTILGGVGAGLSAASGATGSAILKAAGYNYHNTEVAQAAAVGGAILFALYALCTSKKNTEDRTITISDIAFSAGLAALSGVLGAAILGFKDMTPGQYAAAAATGSVVINGGLAVVCSRLTL